MRRGTRKGNPYLKATLVTAAACGARAKGTYLRDKFHRLRARMGAKRAAVAIAHKILVATFPMLQRQLSPPWHVSTPDPAHPREFSGRLITEAMEREAPAWTDA